MYRNLNNLMVKNHPNAFSNWFVLTFLRPSFQLKNRKQFKMYIKAKSH